MNNLVVFDPVKAEMAEYKKQNEALVFDYEDPKGNKDARSHVAKLRKVKTHITNIHKDAKADALAVCNSLDAKKRELFGEVEEMIAVHATPIKAIEDRLQHEADEKAEAERLEAERIKEEQLEALRKREEAIAAAEAKVKADQEEVEREKEKVEAAKQAEIDAQKRVQEAKEQAERDKQEALEQAEKDKDAAILAEKERIHLEHEAEQERVRKEAEAEAAETTRLADIEKKRIANKKHRASIEQEIYNWFFSRTYFSTMENGDKIVDGLIDNLKKGNVPNVSINY